MSPLAAFLARLRAAPPEARPALIAAEIDTTGGTSLPGFLSLHGVDAATRPADLVAAWIGEAEARASADEAREALMETSQ